MNRAKALGRLGGQRADAPRRQRASLDQRVDERTLADL